MDKKYRYYDDIILKELYKELKPVPEMYTKNYEGEVVCMDFLTFKMVLNLKPNKTIKGCSNELWKVCEDLGYKLNTTVTTSIHNKWIWFNILGEFRGYHEDNQLALELQRQDLAKENQKLLDETILNGTYGINNPKEGGGVYLLSCGEYFKIGHSVNIKSRLSSIKTSNPYEVELITKYTPYKVNNKLLERQLHKHFKNFHHMNEWFHKGFTEDEFITACIKFYTRTVKKLAQVGE